MTKRRKLSHEILGLLGVTLAISVFLFAFLSMTAVTIVENYCDHNDLTLTASQSANMELWIRAVSLVTAVLFFIVLLLFLLGQRIAYIRNLTEGVEALRTHRMDFVMPLEGNNELTQLAETINYLSATEKQIREKERALQKEKEQLIRTLSHDIRTPLTSIMSYSELLLVQAQSMQQKSLMHSQNAQEQQLKNGGTSYEQSQTEYLELILKKAEQIKELTDILLDGGKRSSEFFEDARLLMEQLAAEMEEALEDAIEKATDETLAANSLAAEDIVEKENNALPDVAVTGLPGNCGLCISFSDCPAFSGTFDVGELRRIFDNLTSNILKYADLTKPVTLVISMEEQALVIRQENFKKTDTTVVESFRIGLASIRRIAHNYGGSAEVAQDDTRFMITITLLDF